MTTPLTTEHAAYPVYLGLDADTAETRFTETLAAAGIPVGKRTAAAVRDVHREIMVDELALSTHETTTAGSLAIDESYANEIYVDLPAGVHRVQMRHTRGSGWEIFGIVPATDQHAPGSWLERTRAAAGPTPHPLRATAHVAHVTGKVA